MGTPGGIHCAGREQPAAGTVTRFRGGEAASRAPGAKSIPRIDVVAHEALFPEAESVLQEIEQTMGKRPNLFRTYAHHPPLLTANREQLKATMMQGDLSRRHKEATALLAGQDNGCEYCIAAHSGALKSLGVDDSTLDSIRRGRLAEAGFEEREIRLVELMRKANQAPHDVTGEEIDELRSRGYGDAHIIQAHGVMETFAGFNCFLDSLDVEIG